TAQQAGDERVLVGRPDGAVDHQHDHVGLVDGPFGLEAHLPGQRLVGTEPATGVDDGERPPDPFGVEDLAIPGHTGPLLDDRLPPPDDAVDQRALADVGPADHGDGRDAAGAHRRTASTRASPPVPTTSTGRGRSGGAEPSRNTPRDSVTSGSRYRTRAPAGSASSTEATSPPASNPVTAMLPPNSRLRTGSARTGRPAASDSAGSTGSSTQAPYSPVSSATSAASPSPPVGSATAPARRAERYPSAGAPSIHWKKPPRCGTSAVNGAPASAAATSP